MVASAVSILYRISAGPIGYGTISLTILILSAAEARSAQRPSRAERSNAEGRRATRLSRLGHLLTMALIVASFSMVALRLAALA